MSSEKGSLIWSAGYGLLVLAGTAVLGFVVAPYVGIATGLFVIDTEARGFFSLLTLKGTPFLVGLGILSTLVYPRSLSLRRPVRAVVLALNVLVAWLIAGAVALISLG
jgi:hypothetical protein